jgi:hypothetical protein
MLFQQRFYKVEAWLCRPHARQFIGSWLVRTLIQGWWGAISFFVNFFVIAADLVQLTKALFMRKPAESN